MPNGWNARPVCSCSASSSRSRITANSCRSIALKTALPTATITVSSALRVDIASGGGSGFAERLALAVRGHRLGRFRLAPFAARYLGGSAGEQRGDGQERRVRGKPGIRPRPAIIAAAV